MMPLEPVQVLRASREVSQTKPLHFFSAAISSLTAFRTESLPNGGFISTLLLLSEEIHNCIDITAPDASRKMRITRVVSEGFHWTLSKKYVCPPPRSLGSLTKPKSLVRSRSISSDVISGFSHLPQDETQQNTSPSIPMRAVKLPSHNLMVYTPARWKPDTSQVSMRGDEDAQQVRLRNSGIFRLTPIPYRKHKRCIRTSRCGHR